MTNSPQQTDNMPSMLSCCNWASASQVVDVNPEQSVVFLC